MIGNKYDRLIDRLSDATSSHKLKWEKSSRENEFKVFIDKNVITIHFHEKSDIFAMISATPSYNDYVELTILGESGNILDSLKLYSDSDDYNKLKDLFLKVRRNYYNIDETIDNIISHI